MLDTLGEIAAAMEENQDVVQALDDAIGSRALQTDLDSAKTRITNLETEFNLIKDKYVPSGMIMIWSGSATNIPTGWALCDGTNNTPDLRDRFVVGAGSTYSVGAKGGEATHTLTIDEMPKHNHLMYASIHNGTEFGVVPGESFYGEVAILQNTGNVHNGMITNGGTQPHNNLPPYYALCYIMKL